MHHPRKQRFHHSSSIIVMDRKMNFWKFKLLKLESETSRAGRAGARNLKSNVARTCLCVETMVKMNAGCHPSSTAPRSAAFQAIQKKIPSVS
jgi:hypothetical protein